VIRTAHHDGAEPVLVAPGGKRWAFVLGFRLHGRERNRFCHPKRPELSNRTCGCSFGIPRRMNSCSTMVSAGSVKTATRVATPL
jgi:hypothetical protein